MELNAVIPVVLKNGTKIFPTSNNENMDFVHSWFLMGSPYPTTWILLSYLLFVLKIGPALMKSREPFKFQIIMPLYNAVQVLISGFLFYTCVEMISNHGLLPKTCVMETEYTRKTLASAHHYYFLAKISELLDTIFFVLRKKNNQVSFLHVYHHTLMVIVSWTSLKYEPSFTLTFLGMANSFVHVFMYTYYGLSTFPSLAKFLWWKKYITRVQLIQFVLIISHFVVHCMTSNCKPSVILSSALISNGILFIYLFGSFYLNTYRNKRSSQNDKCNERTLPDNRANGNGKIQISNGNHFIGNSDSKIIDEGYTSASITLNDTYRIQFNLKKSKEL